jgi:hypothetical protein
VRVWDAAGLDYAHDAEDGSSQTQTEEGGAPGFHPLPSDLYSRTPAPQQGNRLEKDLQTSAGFAVTSLLVSVRTMFEYVTFARIRVCPDGHVKLGSVSGPAVRLAFTRPFFAWKEPPVLTEPFTDSLFDAFGWFPPLLMHA